MTATGVVMLGTLYPLVLDAMGLSKISVGPPFFEAVFVPIMALAIFLMGLGPLLRWKQASLMDAALRLRWAVVVTVTCALLLPFALGRWSAGVSFGLLLAGWILSTCAVFLWEFAGGIDGRKPTWTRLRQTSRSQVGMVVAHAGIAVFVIGVTLVKGYETELDVRMEIGESVQAGGFDFRLDRVDDVVGPNYAAVRGTLTVTRDGKPVTTLKPEKRLYKVQEMAMTEAAIDRGVTRDLYVSMGESVSATAWVMRVQHKPFVNWIWGGCVLMALGGLLAISDRRYRSAARARQGVDAPATAAA